MSDELVARLRMARAMRGSKLYGVAAARIEADAATIARLEREKAEAERITLDQYNKAEERCAAADRQKDRAIALAEFAEAEKEKAVAEYTPNAVAKAYDTARARTQGKA
jgi:hypothetical protein